MPHLSAINPLGMPFIELQSVDSTNNHALARIHAGLARHGEAFFAHEQLAGKGQRGRGWIAEKDANIVLSIIANPYPLPLAQQFQLSTSVAIAVREFFARYAGDDTRIKWPNDLYWQDRKAGGILIENVVGGKLKDNGEQMTDESYPSSINDQPSSVWQWAVIGIGININQTSFPSGLQNPVSLKQITGKHFDTVALAKELCEMLNNHYQKLVAGEFEQIYTRYLTHLYKKEEKVKLKKGNRVFEAIIKTVSPSGRLIVQHTMEEEFDFGEVEWVI